MWPGPVAGICCGGAGGAGATTGGALAHRVGERDDGDGVVGVADVGGAGGGVGGDGAGVVADRGLGWGVAAAGVVGAVAGVAVDHGHTGVFDVGDVDHIGCGVDGDAHGAEPGRDGGR